jgi:hypothetical protein
VSATNPAIPAEDGFDLPLRSVNQTPAAVRLADDATDAMGPADPACIPESRECRGGRGESDCNICQH